MNLLRKHDISIFYWLKNLFLAYPSVAIADGYPTATLTLPTVSVEALDLRSRPFELGDRRGNPIRPWAIDVFADNKAQRDEFSYFILDALESGIPVYEYDSGFSPTVVPQIGALQITEDGILLKVVRVFPGTEEKLYWRMSILFNTVYDSIV